MDEAGGHLADLVVAVIGTAAQVRGQQHVGEGEQRIVGRRAARPRTRRSRPRRSSGRERRGQRRLVDHRPARAVEEERRRAASAPSSAVETKWRVCSVSTTLSDSTSASRNSSSRPTSRAPAAAAASAGRKGSNAITSIPWARPSVASCEPIEPSPAIASVRPVSAGSRPECARSQLGPLAPTDRRHRTRPNRRKQGDRGPDHPLGRAVGVDAAGAQHGQPALAGGVDIDVVDADPALDDQLQMRAPRPSPRRNLAEGLQTARASPISAANVGGGGELGAGAARRSRGRGAERRHPSARPPRGRRRGPRWSCRLLRGRDDRIGQLADALHADGDDVARREEHGRVAKRADAGGGSRRDRVARAAA